MPINQKQSCMGVKMNKGIWYETADYKDLRLDRPIGFLDNGELIMLMPQIKIAPPAQGDYTILGYNWFNMSTGRYRSCACFTSIEYALEPYKGYGIVNLTHNQIMAWTKSVWE